MARNMRIELLEYGESKTHAASIVKVTRALLPFHFPLFLLSCLIPTTKPGQMERLDGELPGRLRPRRNATAFLFCLLESSLQAA